MKPLGFCLRVEKAALRVFFVAVALTAGGMALAADEVSFTLTFADRPLPDLRSFTALRACGLSRLRQVARG